MKENTMKNDLLTCAECADILKCCAATIKRYVREKIIPGFRISNKWRVRSADIQNFIANGGHKSPMGKKTQKGKNTVIM